jgi:hypothetical protein
MGKEANIDLKSIYEAMEEKRASLNITWAAAAHQISRTGKGERSMAVSTIIGLKTRKLVEGDGVLQILLWLGKTPESFISGFGNADGYKLPVPMQGQVLRWDPPALYKSITKRCQEMGITLIAASKQIGGHSPAMLSNLKNSKRVGFPLVMNIVIWLNQPAANFTCLAHN